MKFLFSFTHTVKPPLGPEKWDHYAEDCLKKISGKKALGWPLWHQAGSCMFLEILQNDTD